MYYMFSFFSLVQNNHFIFLYTPLITLSGEKVSELLPTTIDPLIFL